MFPLAGRQGATNPKALLIHSRTHAPPTPAHTKRMASKAAVTALLSAAAVAGLLVVVDAQPIGLPGWVSGWDTPEVTGSSASSAIAQATAREAGRSIVGVLCAVSDCYKKDVLPPRPGGRGRAIGAARPIDAKPLQPKAQKYKSPTVHPIPNPAPHYIMILNPELQR